MYEKEQFRVTSSEPYLMVCFVSLESAQSFAKNLSGRADYKGSFISVSDINDGQGEALWESIPGTEMSLEVH